MLRVVDFQCWQNWSGCGETQERPKMNLRYDYDWLIGRLIDWWMDGWIDWLIDWLIWMVIKIRTTRNLPKGIARISRCWAPTLLVARVVRWLVPTRSRAVAGKSWVTVKKASLRLPSWISKRHLWFNKKKSPNFWGLGIHLWWWLFTCDGFWANKWWIVRGSSKKWRYFRGSLHWGSILR